LWAAIGGGRWSAHLREKSLLRSSPEPTTAAPAGAAIFLGSVVVEVLLLPTAWAPEGNFRSAGSGRWRRLRVFILLGGIVSEPAITQRLEDYGIFTVDGGIFAVWLAEVGRWFLFGNDDGARRAWVAAWSSVVGSSRRVRGALLGTVGASPAYFPCVARRQCRSYRLLARVAIRWHVPSWLLFMSVARLAGGANVMWVVLYRF